MSLDLCRMETGLLQYSAARFVPQLNEQSHSGSKRHVAEYDSNPVDPGLSGFLDDCGVLSLTFCGRHLLSTHTIHVEQRKWT